MENKKVFRIGIDARLWNQTGIGRYIRNLVIQLLHAKNNYEFILFVRSQDVSSVKKLTMDSATIYQIVETDIPWHSAKEQIAFPRLLEKYSLDLVHFPYFSVPIFYKKPYVITVHDLIINYFPTGKASTLPMPMYALKRFGYSLILKTAIKNSKKIITPSEATKKEIERAYHTFPSKISVTLEGVDSRISDFKPDIFLNKNPYFLYVGNAYPHKNIETLVQAFQIFSEKNPTYKLKLVGREDYFYKRLKRTLTGDKGKNIEFLGFVPDDALGGLYKHASATVIPSYMEGFGLTALEAMQMGCLVVASEIPSLQEICKNNAFYFNPSDPLHLAKTLDKVCTLSIQDKNQIIEDSKKHAKLFTWEKTANLTLDVYSSCL